MRARRLGRIHGTGPGGAYAFAFRHVSISAIGRVGLRLESKPVHVLPPFHHSHSASDTPKTPNSYRTKIISFERKHMPSQSESVRCLFRKSFSFNKFYQQSARVAGVKESHSGSFRPCGRVIRKRSYTTIRQLLQASRKIFTKKRHMVQA